MRNSICLVILGLIGCSSGSLGKLDSGTVEQTIGREMVSNTSGLQLGEAIVEDGSCAKGMVHIKGNYCPNVEEICLQWVDAKGNTLADSTRCGEFKYPTRCLSEKKVSMNFCIDTYEFPNVKGQIPRSWMSWMDAKESCEAEGKQLCTAAQWTFACEGEEMRPYPYGDGYHRDKAACNFDNPAKGIDIFKATAPDTDTAILLNNMLVPSGSMDKCHSKFGVFDQIGNVDEFVINESGHPYKSSMVGGHIFGVRNRCRAQTLAHNEYFKWYESSTRCCSNNK